MRLFYIIIILIGCTGCIKEKVSGSNLVAGDSLPDFEVVMNDGTIVTDDSLRGSVSLVMFFHTECSDCMTVLPEVQEIYDEYVGKGVSFAIISREEPADEVSVYWIKKRFDMPYSAQNDRVVYNKFASSSIPRIYISDKEGIIRYVYLDDPFLPDYELISYGIESLLLETKH